MKTTITILFSLLFSSVLFCQQEGYRASMQQGIEKLENASGEAEFLDCAFHFERIANAEKEQWLPCYYASYSLVQLSFNETDNVKRDQLLDRAQEMLDRGLELAPDESELHVLQAFLYPSRILVDPVVRGMEYMQRCLVSLEKARSLNPDNPRTYFLEAMNTLNLPPSFGGGPEAARPIFETAAEKFSTFRNDDPLWPDWGADANREELARLVN